MFSSTLASNRSALCGDVSSTRRTASASTARASTSPTRIAPSSGRLEQPERVLEQLRRSGVGDHPHELAGRDRQLEPGDDTEPDVTELEPRRLVVGEVHRRQVVDASRLQHAEHALRRGSDLGEARSEVLGQRLHGGGDELRQPDGGDQLADLDVAAQREPADDRRHGGDEQPGDQVGHHLVARLRRLHVERGAERLLAHRAVPVSGRRLGTEALDDAQPGHQVGGRGGGVGDVLELGERPLTHRPGHPIEQPHHRRRSEQDEHPERPADHEQGDRHDGDGDDVAERVHQQPRCLTQAIDVAS